MLKQFVGLAFFILACALFVAFIPPNPFGSLNASKLNSYVVIMTYSQDQCKTIRLNATKQQWVENWIALAKDMGFKGVAVAELECYYLDGYLENYLQLINGLGLKATVYFMWRDFTIPVSFDVNASRPINSDFWKPEGFPDNSTKCQAWINWIHNVTLVTRNYPNIEFYLLFMPFRWAGSYQADFYNYTGYRYWMQEAVNTIKELDARPVLLVSDGIELEDPELANYVPYDLNGIDGYGFTYYSRTYDNFYASRFEEYFKFYQSKNKQFQHGHLFLAEWGWQTTANIYGQCANENRKCELINETVRAITSLGIENFAYFCLQDFPSENADWGLAYYNFTLKPSGETLKQILKK